MLNPTTYQSGGLCPLWKTTANFQSGGLGPSCGMLGGQPGLAMGVCILASVQVCLYQGLWPLLSSLEDPES